MSNDKEKKYNKTILNKYELHAYFIQIIYFTFEFWNFNFILNSM